MALKQKILLLVLLAIIVEKNMAVPVPVEHRGKRSDDGGPLEAVVEKQAQQISLLQAQLTQQQNTFNEQLSHLASSFETRLNNLTSEVRVLRNKTNTLGQTVAFYAWNTVRPIHTAAYGILVFDHAETNMGNAYNTLTGVFTAPVSGLYHFQTTFLSKNLGGHQGFANIFVGSRSVIEGISDTNQSLNDQTTIGGIVRVTAGQQVYVKNGENVARDFLGSIDDPLTTFSGFLLRADEQ